MELKSKCDNLINGIKNRNSSIEKLQEEFSNEYLSEREYVRVCLEYYYNWFGEDIFRELCIASDFFNNWNKMTVRILTGLIDMLIIGQIKKTEEGWYIQKIEDPIISTSFMQNAKYIEIIMKASLFEKCPHKSRLDESRLVSYKMDNNECIFVSDSELSKAIENQKILPEKE